MRRLVKRRGHLVLAGYALAVFAIDALWRFT
jgi:hypothetical protein